MDVYLKSKACLLLLIPLLCSPFMLMTQLCLCSCFKGSLAQTARGIVSAWCPMNVCFTSLVSVCQSAGVPF